MSNVTLLAQTLNTKMDALDVYKLSQQRWLGTQALLTNIVYYDDAEMQALLKAKHAAYGQHVKLHTSMHELARPILNAQADVLIVDSLNFYVSNIMLLCNSDPTAADEIEALIVQDIQALVQGITDSALSIGHLIILTADVDFDFFIRTEQGKLYRRLIHTINSLLGPVANNYGLLTHGTILWAKGHA